MGVKRKPLVGPAQFARVILLVEDDPDLREMHALTLRLSGYCVFETSDGIEALALLRRVRPHIVLLDLQMPRMDGWEFLSRLRARHAFRDLPVCIISAEPVDPRIEHEVVAHLQKPFLPSTLLAVLERYCSAAQGAAND